MTRTIGWFSCGAASAVAVKLTGAQPVYCETGSEHLDNARFLADCERWFGRPVERLRGRYSDTWDVWTKRRYLAGIEGALCTIELKVMPRLAFQRPDDIHVFGYTADGPDVARADRLRNTYPELTLETPLIERGLTKAACLDMVNLTRARDAARAIAFRQVPSGDAGMLHWKTVQSAPRAGYSAFNAAPLSD